MFVLRVVVPLGAPWGALGVTFWVPWVVLVVVVVITETLMD